MEQGSASLGLLRRDEEFDSLVALMHLEGLLELLQREHMADEGLNAELFGGQELQRAGEGVVDHDGTEEGNLFAEDVVRAELHPVLRVAHPEENDPAPAVDQFKTLRDGHPQAGTLNNHVQAPAGEVLQGFHRVATRRIDGGGGAQLLG